MRGLTIGKLATASGSDVETIRYYERRGLLPPPPRAGNGYRMYPQAAIDRLHFIRRAKRLGFTLAEVEELLKLQDADADRGEVKQLARHKVDDLDSRIRDLRRMRAVLSDLEARCSGSGPAHDCPIIEALNENEPGT